MPNTDLLDSDRIALLEKRIEAIESLLKRVLYVSQQHPLIRHAVKALGKIDL